MSLGAILVFSLVLNIDSKRSSLLQSLAPKYEKLATAFAGDSSKVIIAKVDATEEEGLASRYLPRYPTNASTFYLTLVCCLQIRHPGISHNQVFPCWSFK